MVFPFGRPKISQALCDFEKCSSQSTSLLTSQRRVGVFYGLAIGSYQKFLVTRHQVKKYIHLTTGIKLAIKYLPIPQGQYNGNILTLKTVLREIENMRLLSTSPNVVDFYGLCIHEFHALLCMELMDLSLRHLYHIMHTEKKMEFPEKLVGYIFVKIVDALHFCKSKGVMHRDIKPSNILVNYRYFYKKIEGMRTIDGSIG